MGSIVAKRSSQVVIQQAGSPPEPPSRSAASTASVSSVGIPLPIRPLGRTDEHYREQTPTATGTGTPPPLSPTPSSPAPTDGTSSSESNLSDEESEPTVRAELVTKCINILENGFGLAFEREQLLNSVQDVHCGPNETLISVQQKAVGVYVVEEGGLEVLSPKEDVVLCRLAVGDFCGELSSFFHFPCTATVRAEPGHNTTVLLLPLQALTQSSPVEEVPMYRLLKWCTKRSYIGTVTMFDKLDSSLLINAQIANCLKSPKSLFSTWSSEARSHIATKSSPILFSSGDVLYEAGEQPTLYFLILRGSVGFSGELSRSVTIRSSSQGYSIGQEMLTGSRMTQTVTATSPLLVVPLTMNLLTETVNKFPNNAPMWRDIQAKDT